MGFDAHVMILPGLADEYEKASPTAFLRPNFVK